mgnify:CR=1 FL=1
MKTIKIIDLLNKIANGEEVPRKIKINNVIYEYIGYMYCTEKANYQDIEDYLFGKWNFNILNDEVEIIEEPKKIEKLNSEPISRRQYLCDESTIDFLKADIINIVSKVNELIDEVNKLKEE